MERAGRLTMGRISALVAGVAALLVWASPAAAFHIPGATYTANPFPGVTGSFTVSPDGSGITEAHATNLPGNSCIFTSIDATYPTPLPITDHAFSDTSPPFTASGRFTSKQTVQGTVRMRVTGPGSCDTGELPFTATTTASSQGSFECQAAQAAVDSAQQAVDKAKKKVKKAKTPKAKKRAKKKLKEAQKQLEDAQAALPGVC
jgi:hypothetical protein